MPPKKGSFYKKIDCGSNSGYQRHYRLKEPSCDPCRKAASKHTRNYFLKNKDKIKNNPAYKAKRLRMKVRRYARKRGNKTEPYSFEQVLEKYGTVCYLCNVEIDMDAPRNCTGDNWEMGLHIDHVIDLQYGGADSLENVRPTHAYCNIHKSKIKPSSR